tara:strand:+ start:189 stop:365 length:177 start_codon:yes stop_codon:yes gene_type:complete
MCIICVEFQSKKLTPFEAVRNLSEMQEIVGEEHVKEVLNLIIERDKEESEEDWKYGSD